MGIQHPLFPILILLILALGNVSDGRHLRRIAAVGKDDGFTREFNSQYSQRFSDEPGFMRFPEEPGNDSVDPVYKSQSKKFQGGRTPFTIDCFLEGNASHTAIVIQSFAASNNTEKGSILAPRSTVADVKPDISGLIGLRINPHDCGIVPNWAHLYY
ncbi:hypothetical protein C3L33_15999, partial [Rhododendron williamsianum]